MHQRVALPHCFQLSSASQFVLLRSPPSPAIRLRAAAFLALSLQKRDNWQSSSTFETDFKKLLGVKQMGCWLVQTLHTNLGLFTKPLHCAFHQTHVHFPPPLINGTQPWVLQTNSNLLGKYSHLGKLESVLSPQTGIINLVLLSQFMGRTHYNLFRSQI